MTTAVLTLKTTDGKLSTEQLDIAQQFMDLTAKHHVQEEQKIVEQYKCSDACAMDVSYLRTRSRWSPELEARLVKEHSEGKKIMICDWPDHVDGNYDPYTGVPL